MKLKYTKIVVWMLNTCYQFFFSSSFLYTCLSLAFLILKHFSWILNIIFLIKKVTKIILLKPKKILLVEYWEIHPRCLTSSSSSSSSQSLIVKKQFGKCAQTHLLKSFFNDDQYKSYSLSRFSFKRRLLISLVILFAFWYEII